MILLEINGKYFYEQFKHHEYISHRNMAKEARGKKEVNLKTGVTRKQRSNFSKTEHFLPPDTYTHV